MWKRQRGGYSLNNIGSLYQKWVKPEQALEYFHKALKIDEEVQDLKGEAFDNNNIGSVYEQLNKPKEALDYFQKSLNLFEKLKDTKSADIVKEHIRNLT